MCLFTESRVNSMASPLLLAIKNDEENTAKSILLNGQFSDLNKQGVRKDGSALFFACCKGMTEMVHLLILHGADIESRTSYGATSLHAAVDHNQLEITRLLLGYGANVNAETKRGDTACHFAAYHGYATLVQTLAEAGADVTVENSKSQSPSRLAASRDHHSIVKYLKAVADLAKHKPRRCSRHVEEPVLYQRAMSHESLSEDHRDKSSFPKMNITVDMDTTWRKTGDHSSFDPDNSETKICNSINNSFSDKSSMVSPHNICGSQLTQVLKEKQYTKDLSWDD